MKMEDEINKGLPSQTSSANYGKKTGGKPLNKYILQGIMSVNDSDVSKIHNGSLRLGITRKTAKMEL